MDLNRAGVIDANFLDAVIKNQFPPFHSQTTPEQASLGKDAFIDLFHTQCVSRHLDLLARELKETGKSFYTIGSSGHEGNAAIGAYFDVSDMAFLHYRSCAFVIARAKKHGEDSYIFDQLLSFMASSEDPIAGGRHKVLGSLRLNIPPQTSIIASHLPKSVGAALSIKWAKSIKGIESYQKLKNDSVVLCGFGDASVNHSTAQGAFHAARWIVRQGLPLPIVFICEDNGWGISVPTPPDWIEQNFQANPSIHYIPCDGRNLADVYLAAQQAAHIARNLHQPVFLHMKTVRLLGHAGSDIEFHYRQQQAIEKDEADDPLLHTAHRIILQDWLSGREIIDLYQTVRADIHRQSESALKRPKLISRKEIEAAIIPPKHSVKTTAIPDMQARKRILGKNQNWLTEPRNMAQHINLALTDLMLAYPNVVVFGEDVGRKGGVYRVTQDLQQRFGVKRVFDTLLDEQTILGTAIGFSHNGFLPIPEIQFLAYTHNTSDQIRGEAATLSYFSNGQFTNPMVIRIPALAYQKGFGGHFHNDNAIAFLREIPGIMIAVPSQARDAGLLLKECHRLAYQEQRVVVFLEPIALYMVKDRAKPGDHLALQHYPDEKAHIRFHEIGVEGNRDADTVVITFANGMHLARQAAYQLNAHYQVEVMLLDLRWLHPLPFAQIAEAIKGKKHVLIVDETRKTGSISEALMTWFVETQYPLPLLSRVCAADCFIPLGDAFEKVLPSCQEIIEQILAFKQDQHYARSLSNR